MPTDPEHMTVAELGVYMASLDAIMVQKQQQAASDDEARKQRISEAYTSFLDLLGTPDQPPYDPAAWQAEQGKETPNLLLRPTIRSVSQHSQETLAANSGLVFELLLQCAEILTVNSARVAKVIGEQP